MRWLADLVYLAVGLLYLPVAVYNALIVGKNRRGWRHRVGSVPRFAPHPERIWIHAVSLGEINATPKLVEALRHRRPGCDIVVSTTTDTGNARAVQLYGQERVFRFPLDFSLVISRVLRRVGPAMIVLVELEVWYNLVRTATRRGIPVAVVNGRLTERSALRLGRLGGIARSMFADLAWVGAQDDSIAARFAGLGTPADRVEVTSSLKWDTATVADSVEGAEALAAEVGLDRTVPFWVCGSTGPGEESLILHAYRRLLDDRASVARDVPACSTGGGRCAAPALAIVPRKPERFDEVAQLIERSGLSCVRRSRPGDTSQVGRPAVVLGDTMGELRKFYALADVVFVGRSLVPLGGSDPMEVAALGKAMVVGPHTDNFRLPIDALCKADAVRIVETPDQLAGVIGSLLGDAAARRALGQRAQQVVRQNQGATERTVSRLIEILDRKGRLSDG